MAETQAEIKARIDELGRVAEEFWSSLTADRVEETIRRRIDELRAMLEGAQEDLFSSVLRSHDAVCRAKGMGPKAAYGQDPALYYSLAVCGEAGEMGNKIVKALRNGNDAQATRDAVISELPDVIIYAAVLAHVLDLDLTRLVNEKVEVVIRRAVEGHYGGQLRNRMTEAEILQAYRDGNLTRVEAVSRLAQLDDEDGLRAEAAELRRAIRDGQTVEIGSHCGVNE